MNRPRGLCWRCYYTPGVRERYLSTSKFAQKASKGEFERTHDTGPPAEPTDAPPGSPAKFAVLCERAERGEVLWHPDDKDLPGPETVWVEQNTRPTALRGLDTAAAPRVFREPAEAELAGVT